MIEEGDRRVKELFDGYGQRVAGIPRERACWSKFGFDRHGCHQSRNPQSVPVVKPPRHRLYRRRVINQLISEQNDRQRKRHFLRIEREREQDAESKQVPPRNRALLLTYRDVIYQRQTAKREAEDVVDRAVVQKKIHEAPVIGEDQRG